MTTPTLCSNPPPSFMGSKYGNKKSTTITSSSLYSIMSPPTTGTVTPHAVDSHTAPEHRFAPPKKSLVFPNQQNQPTFFPVDDECKDLSLRQLLELADDFLWGDGATETTIMAEDEALSPTPLNLPDCHTTVSSFANANQASSNSFVLKPFVLASNQHKVMQTAPPALVTPSPTSSFLPMLAPSSMTDKEAMNGEMNPTTTTSSCNPKKRRRRGVTSHPVPCNSSSTSKNKKIKASLPSSSNDQVNQHHHNDTDCGGAGSEEEETAARAVHEDHGDRFRPYQAGQWNERFQDLLNYRAEFGHCLVPHTYTKNLPLARWVKRQRYQYKLWQENKSRSTLTEERRQALETIGFCWDSQNAAWGERLQELQAFQAVHKHCSVPSNYASNPQLATWVKCQRRQYKLHQQGRPSNMTKDRIKELDAIGFVWLLRNYNSRKTKTPQE